MRQAFLWFILLALPLSAAEDSGWRDYVNVRFGFKMSYPADLVPSREPENNDGREYHTQNKDFSVTAYGHYLVDATLNSLWKDDLKEFGAHITYQRKSSDWYVISGVKDGTEFYRKVHTKGDRCAVLHFTYSQAKAKEYNPWVEKIVKSFEPFLKVHYQDAK